MKISRQECYDFILENIKYLEAMKLKDVYSLEGKL